MMPVESTCADCGGDCYKTCWANEPDLCQGCRDKRTAVKASGNADRAWQIGRDVLAGKLATHDPSKYVVIEKAAFMTPTTDHTTERENVELTITLPVTLAWDSDRGDDGRLISIRAATVTPEDLAKAVGIALDDYAQTTEIEEREYP